MIDKNPIIHTLGFTESSLRELAKLPTLTLPNTSKGFKKYLQTIQGEIDLESYGRLPKLISGIDEQFGVVKSPDFFKALRRKIGSLARKWQDSIRPRLLEECTIAEASLARIATQTERKPVLKANAPDRKSLEVELSDNKGWRRASIGKRSLWATILHSNQPKESIELKERILFFALENLLKESNEEYAAKINKTIEDYKKALLSENQEDLQKLINKRLSQLAYLIDYQLLSCYEKRETIKFTTERVYPKIEIEITKLEQLLKQFRLFQKIEEESKSLGIQKAIEAAFTVPKFRSDDKRELPTEAQVANKVQNSRQFIDFTAIQRKYKLAQYQQ